MRSFLGPKCCLYEALPNPDRRLRLVGCRLVLGWMGPALASSLRVTGGIGHDWCYSWCDESLLGLHHHMWLQVCEPPPLFTVVGTPLPRRGPNL